jgi:hypothetical protein
MPINEKQHKLKEELKQLFLKKYNLTEEELSSSEHNYFRYLCFKFNYFMKHIPLCKIKKNQPREAVLIEFRCLPHLEFLIRNAIFKIGDEWSYTVVCGNVNYEYMVNICSSISSQINIIKIQKNDMKSSEYSEMLTSIDFWNLLKGEKICIYQEDSCIFQHNINDFLSFDYIGAPFPKRTNDTPNSVGNGGFSIRSKSKMIEVINAKSVFDTKFNSSTLQYMKKINITFPPEDVYFSKNMQEMNIGQVSDWDTASLFSSESIFNKNSIGGHKFWISNKLWTSFFKGNFKYSLYEFHSDIIEYLKFNKISLICNKTDTVPNAFDVDLYFFCKTNNFPYTNNIDVLKQIKNIGLNGFIYHPKQLLNIYPNLLFYTFLDNIYVFHECNSYPIQDFVSKFVYQLSYQKMSSIIMKKKFSNFDTTIDLLIIVFIGNEERGLDLIRKISVYKKFQEFNISFCFNSADVFGSIKLKQEIKNNFKNYGVYISKNLGTDITSTILMVDDIYKEYNFKHIIKLHTKSISKHYEELTNYLLDKPLNKLLHERNNYCNCIGNKKFYTDLVEDIFNNDLKIKHASEIDCEKLFVAGTIFYCPAIVFKKVSEFIQKNNYRCYLLNNLYENNSINKDFSPIHFLERVFGVIYL